MNLRSLEIFQTVCDEGTITNAAKKLYMTQPAISHAIHDLEVELNITLFDRKGKRIYLNSYGQTFLKHTQRVLSSYDDLKQSIVGIQEEAKIKLGSSITIANDCLPSVLVKLKERYPDTRIEVCVERARQVLERLENRSIDIALVEGVIHNPEWIQECFSSYKLKIVCAKCHTLSGQNFITWDDMERQAWLLREEGSAVRDTFESVCQLHNIKINPLWTSVNSQALLQAVRVNLGISMLPETIIEVCSFRNELHVLEIEGTPLMNKNHIVYRKEIFKSEVLTELITCIKAYK